MPSTLIIKSVKLATELLPLVIDAIKLCRSKK